MSAINRYLLLNKSMALTNAIRLFYERITNQTDKTKSIYN